MPIEPRFNESSIVIKLMLYFSFFFSLSLEKIVVVRSK